MKKSLTNEEFGKKLIEMQEKENDGKGIGIIQTLGRYLINDKPEFAKYLVQYNKKELEKYPNIYNFIIDNSEFMRDILIVLNPGERLTFKKSKVFIPIRDN